MPLGSGQLDAAAIAAIDQNLDRRLPLDAVFRDETGKSVALGEFFGKKPVWMVLPFYKCTGTCPQMVNGMIAATEWIEEDLSNEVLTVEELDEVDVQIWRKTDLGYAVIVNNRHEGLLYHNEIYRPIEIGDKFDGFVKSIKPGNKLDIVLGQMGYGRVEGEAEKI